MIPILFQILLDTRSLSKRETKKKNCGRVLENKARIKSEARERNQRANRFSIRCNSSMTRVPGPSLCTRREIIAKNPRKIPAIVRPLKASRWRTNVPGLIRAITLANVGCTLIFPFFFFFKCYSTRVHHHNLSRAVIQWNLPRNERYK